MPLVYLTYVNIVIFFKNILAILITFLLLKGGVYVSLRLSSYGW